MKRLLHRHSAEVALAALACVIATGCGSSTAGHSLASSQIRDVGVPAALGDLQPHTVFSPGAGGNALAGSGRVLMPGEWAWGRNDSVVGVRLIPLATGPRGAVVESVDHIYEHNGKVRVYGHTWIRTWSVKEGP